MSVKASVSISEQQDAFARQLVETGHYPSLSAVMQRGLELVREQTERNQAELAVLHQFFEDRAKGDFEPLAETVKATESMIARKRKDHGL